MEQYEWLITKNHDPQTWRLSFKKDLMKRQGTTTLG